MKSKIDPHRHTFKNKAINSLNPQDSWSEPGLYYPSLEYWASGGLAEGTCEAFVHN